LGNGSVERVCLKTGSVDGFIACSKVLDKFYIGDLEKPVGAPTEWGYMEYNDDVSENSFYNTLKARVEAHFKSKKVRVGCQSPLSLLLRRFG
jgi:hypothetical protein